MEGIEMVDDYEFDQASMQGLVNDFQDYQSQASHSQEYDSEDDLEEEKEDIRYQNRETLQA